MSGPYRFNQESAKSPLDRTAPAFGAGQPVSYKTNVNRAKTKKWVTAKKNAYDGDDWGEYDEYDEYGVDQDQEPPPPQPPTSQRYYANMQQSQQPPRSFTDPSGPGPQTARRNSFEAGEEHRAFSSSIPQPQQPQAQQQYSAPQRQASGADSDVDVDPQGRRDFSPSAMPHPLQTRISQIPSEFHASPQTTQFPPRKSSIGQSDAPVATSPRSNPGSPSDKPLPFIRPADIYRRVEEERERERASMDSSRPSLDSLLGRPKDDLQSPTSDGGKSLQPLETVAERKSEYLPDFNAAFVHGDKQTAPSGTSQPVQPIQTGGVSKNHAPVVSPQGDQGFRSVVDNAFTRIDDQRSIPPTPISKDSDSDMSRANTGSTMGISPIMSRVPGSGTSAMNRDAGDTPAIAEEPSETVASVPQTTPAFAHDATKSSAPQHVFDHSRNLSSTSIPRTGLATPTRLESPARSPIIAPVHNLPESKAAEVTTGSPDKSHEMEGGLDGPSSAYATREADIATAMKTMPGAGVPGLSAAEKDSQAAFLESHVAQSQSPIDDALPRSRSESPSKGRVQALAGKFGDVASSRRGSTQSNLSRNSVQSWERSRDNSRAASPTKGDHSPVKEFRPHLPGQWESYATNVPTPLDQAEKGFSLEHDKVSAPLESVDFTPTTATRPNPEVTPAGASDPHLALKNAGAALGQSLLTGTAPATETRGMHGDVYAARPLQPERTESALSSIPPTPPAKDTPANEHPPSLLAQDGKVHHSTPQQRSDFFPEQSEASPEDEESDRLRKEIVASLSPARTSESAMARPNSTSLQPASSGANRASSILPSEYDSYWADEDHVSPLASQDGSIRPLSKGTAPLTTTSSNEPPRPVMLNRFSWEESGALAAPVGSNKDTPKVEPVQATHEEKIPSPAIERAAEEERHQWSEVAPDPYFGPGHQITVTKPDPITEPDLEVRSPAIGHDHEALANVSREQTRSPGLHVVNSAVNPEAVDLPPRLSADVIQDEPKSVQNEGDKQVPNPAISTAVPVPESENVAPVAPATPVTATTATVTSPTSGKALDIREIATINSASERIVTYNRSRDHWATQDHGLEGWLSSALDANPELTKESNSMQRTSTGTLRHKHTASLSLLGKFGSSSAQNSENPSASGQLPVGNNSPTAGSPSDRRVGSAQMQRELQAKGKDLLHTAGVLSGKGMTSAKGLFAKGKSRFGNRDKVEK